MDDETMTDKAADKMPREVWISNKPTKVPRYYTKNTPYNDRIRFTPAADLCAPVAQEAADEDRINRLASSCAQHLLATKIDPGFQAAKTTPKKIIASYIRAALQSRKPEGEE